MNVSPFFLMSGSLGPVLME